MCEQRFGARAGGAGAGAGVAAGGEEMRVRMMVVEERGVDHVEIHLCVM